MKEKNSDPHGSVPTLCFPYVLSIACIVCSIHRFHEAHDVSVFVKLNSHAHYYLQPGWQRIGEKYWKDGFHTFSSDCNYIYSKFCTPVLKVNETISYLFCNLLPVHFPMLVWESTRSTCRVDSSLLFRCPESTQRIGPLFLNAGASPFSLLQATLTNVGGTNAKIWKIWGYIRTNLWTTESWWDGQKTSKKGRWNGSFVRWLEIRHNGIRQNGHKLYFQLFKWQPHSW